MITGHLFVISACASAIRFIRGRRRFHAYAGTLEGSRLPHFARVCCADVTIAHRALWYLSNSSGPHASRDVLMLHDILVLQDLLVLTVFVTWVSQGDHGMNRCLRSLSCFFTLAGLALFSTDATARASHKPHTQKAHEATKKSHAGKDARPHRSAALGKNRHTKHASAQSKAKRPEASPAP